MWICRSCRPGIAYSVSKVQSASRKASVQDMLMANTVVNYVQEDPKRGITFKAIDMWPARADDPHPVIVAVSDASHGNEYDWVPGPPDNDSPDLYDEDEWQVREPFRSQGGKLICLAPERILCQECSEVHLVSFSSTVQKRVVNSTNKAETYQLTDVVEAGDLL